MASVLIAIQGCGKNDLSRSEAKNKISAELKLPITITVDVKKDVTPKEILKLGSMHYYEQIGNLQDSSLIKISQINSPGQIYPGFHFELTEAGKKYLTSNPNGINVKTCEIKMGDITGIQFEGDKRKAVVKHEVFIQAYDFVKFIDPAHSSQT